MAIQLLPGPFEFPPIVYNSNQSSAASFLTYVLNAANEKVAFMLRFGKAGNIDKIGFLLASVVSQPTSNYQIRVETVDETTGFPTGTLIDANATGQWIPPFTPGWQTVDLAAAVPVTQGQLVAVVISAPASNFGNVSVNHVVSLFDLDNQTYAATFISSWTKVTAGSPVVAIRYDDATYAKPVGIAPFSQFSFQDLDTGGGAPNHVGVKIRAPFNFRAKGIFFCWENDGSSVDMKMSIFDANNNLVTQVDWRTAQSAQNGTYFRKGLYFVSDIDFNKDAWYRIAFHSDVGGSMRIQKLKAASSAVLGAFLIGGDRIWTEAVDPAGAGDWTDDDTATADIGFLIAGLSDGVAPPPALSPITAKYRQILLKLLPLGPLWDNLSQTFRDFWEAFAEELRRAEERMFILIDESDPGKSTDALLLQDWERISLLPEELPDTGDTEAQRQQVVDAKMRTSYSGPSRKFFEDLAAKLGMDVTVTDISSNDPARVGTARVGTARTNAVGNAFIWFVTVNADPNSQLGKFQKMVSRLKPAHTTVIYL